MRQEGCRTAALLVSTLLERGANTNVRRSDGETPLMLAAAGGCAPIVRQLLANKADVKATNMFGETARIKAERGGYIEIVALIGASQN
jgi:uncharacterized protein